MNMIQRFDEAWLDAGEEYPTRKMRVLQVFKNELSSLRERVEGMKIEVPRHLFPETIPVHTQIKIHNEAIDAVLRIIDEQTKI